MAILHDLALAAEGAALRNLGVAGLFPGPLAPITADAADRPLGHPVQVAPDPGELAVRVAVGAVVDVLPGQPRHEGTELQEPRGGILQSPEAKPKLLDDLQSPLHQAVALFQPPGPASQDPAVFGANGGSPDHVKVARRELRERLPRADVRADGRVGFGVDVKRGDFPTEFREGSAHRASPREELQQAAHRFPCRAGRPATSAQRTPRSSRPA